jgi:hypothetical protein
VHLAVTDASVSSTNANADVKSAIKSDEIPPLIEGSSSSSSTISSESDREEMERVPLLKFCYRRSPATLGPPFSAVDFEGIKMASKMSS